MLVVIMLSAVMMNAKMSFYVSLSDVKLSVVLLMVEESFLLHSV